MGIYNRARVQLAPPNMDFTHGGCRAFRVEAGYLKDAEEMLGGVTNLNIDSEMIDFTRDTLVIYCPPSTGRA